MADIIGGLELADLSPLDAASRQQLIRVKSAGEQLARLSDEVLALITGDQAGTPADATTPLALPPFLADIEARWSAHARAKGARFVLEPGDDLPPRIGCDRAALERILANLIGNAVKHAGQGEVTLAIGMRPREALCFTIRDSGPGFSDAALAHLFEAGGRPADSTAPGSGLGLHIVRDLAERLGGRMQVANRALGGAEVMVIIPRTAWAPGLSDATTPRPLPDLAGYCVLVAEDNRTNQLVLRQMLETLGAKCRVAEDGQAALDALRDGGFDLALVDIEMPRLSGLDVIAALRAGETAQGAAPLPVLAITAFVLSANRDEIYAAGADAILTKPIMSLESFGEAVAAVLAKRSPERGAALARAVGAAPAQPALSALHLDRLLALAGEDQGRELLDRLIDDFRSVQTGIDEGLNAPDHALLRARSHVLISLAGAVGADSLQTMAEAMNTATHARDIALARVLAPKLLRQLDEVLRHLRGELARRFPTEAP